MTRGFTLFETILYIAFLSLVMTGAVFTAYSLTQATGREDANALRQEEGNFILRKLSWALSSASALSVPEPDELTVTRYGGPTVYVRQNGNAVEMKERGGTFEPLSTSTEPTAISFSPIPASGTARGVSISLAIGSSTFSMTEYLRP